MRIQLELQTLQASLDIITKLAPPISGNITFSSDGKKVRLISGAELSRCTTVVPCEVDKKGEFAIPLQVLKDATKGREKIDLLYKNSILVISSGRYKAELSTVDVIPLDELEDEDGHEIRLEQDQSAWLRKALKDTALKPTALFSSWMPVGVKFSPKSAFVCCYDTQHMNWSTTKKVTGDFECVLPIDTMMAIVELFHKLPFTIRQTKTRVEVKTKYTQIYLNTPTLDDLPSLSDVQEKIKEASKLDSSTFRFDKLSFLTFLDNAKAVVGKERAEVKVVAQDKRIATTIQTGQGIVSAEIKGKGNGGFKVDYEYLVEGLNKANEQVELNVVQDAFLSMKLASSSIIIALNQ